MTVSISKPALNLREELIKAQTNVQKIEVEQYFTGDTTTTTFELPNGFKPIRVWVGGSKYREGSGEDWTASFDGHLYSVVFAVAPAAVDIDVLCEVIL